MKIRIQFQCITIDHVRLFYTLTPHTLPASHEKQRFYLPAWLFVPAVCPQPAVGPEEAPPVPPLSVSLYCADKARASAFWRCS